MTTAPSPAAALDGLAAALGDAADRIAAGEGAEVELRLAGGAGAAEAADVVAAAERLLQAVRRSHALEAAVHELFEALSHHLRLDYLAHEALNRVVEHTGATGGAVVLRGAAAPDVAAAFDFTAGPGALAAALAEATAAAEPVQLRPLEGRTPALAVPFSGESGTLGAMLLTGIRLDAEMRRLLALLGRALGFAVSNAIAHAAAEERAATDPLTGCANRRAGLASLEESVRRAHLGGPPVGVLMIDLDHFKRVNDRHGHQAGDAVLHAAGTALASVFRDGDVVLRYGGEEFAVVVGGSDAAELARLGERVRARIAALAPADGAGATVPVTASVGAAAWEAGESVAQLLGRADRALYAAKAAGRDRVVLAGA